MRDAAVGTLFLDGVAFDAGDESWASVDEVRIPRPDSFGKAEQGREDGFLYCTYSTDKPCSLSTRSRSTEGSDAKEAGSSWSHTAPTTASVYSSPPTDSLGRGEDMQRQVASEQTVFLLPWRPEFREAHILKSTPYESGYIEQMDQGTDF